jgi:hypothetical protein
MSVTITTYNITADNHVLSPTLTPIQSNISAVHKENTNMLHPTLILSGSVGQAFNYIYISEYGRYYFLKERTYSQQKYICTFDVDPLRSWKSRIKNLEVIANRSSSYYNTYQKDDSIPFENRSIISTQPFSAGFGGECLILAVNGGGAPAAPTIPGGDE